MVFGLGLLLVRCDPDQLGEETMIRTLLLTHRYNSFRSKEEPTQCSDRPSLAVQ